MKDAHGLLSPPGGQPHGGMEGSHSEDSCPSGMRPTSGRKGEASAPTHSIAPAASATSAIATAPMTSTFFTPITSLWRASPAGALKSRRGIGGVLARKGARDAR